MSRAESLAERLALVVITDPECGTGRDLVEVVRAALQGGAPAIQLRWKEGAARDMVELGRRLKEETERTGALLFVNDRVDVALVIRADGAHVGADDLPVAAARAIVPPGFLLGRSVDTPQEALAAERDGADYVGVGAVYATPSKLDTGPSIGLEGIRAVRQVSRLPIVAIGGIDAGNAQSVAQVGADGVAVIRAVMQAERPERAVSELLEAVRRGSESRPR